MKKRHTILWASVALLLLVTMACAEVTPAAPSVQGPTSAAPVVTSTALRATIEGLQVEEYQHAIEAEQQRRQAEQTLAAVAAHQTAAAEVARQTTEAQQWAYTLTAEARQVEMTAVAWETTVEAGQVYATATVEAARLQATATVAAEQTATAAAAQREAATSTAEAGARATADARDAIVWSENATATSQANDAVATVQVAQVRRAEADARRSEVVGYLLWILVAVAVVALVLGLYLFMQAKADRERMVQIEPHALGVYVQEGGRRLALPDRAHRPVLVIDGESREVSDEDQRATTARAQEIRLVSAAHPPAGSGQEGERLLSRVAARRSPQTNAPGIRDIRLLRRPRHAAAAGLIPPHLAQALEAIDGQYREIPDEE
jgi:hypothetical protein